MAVSTYAEATAQYLASLRYESEGSVSMARDLVEACDALALLLPSSASFRDSAQSFDTAAIGEKRTRALEWIQAYESSTNSPAARFFNFRSDFR